MLLGNRIVNMVSIFKCVQITTTSKLSICVHTHHTHTHTHTHTVDAVSKNYGTINSPAFLVNTSRHKQCDQNIATHTYADQSKVKREGMVLLACRGSLGRGGKVYSLQTVGIHITTYIFH